MDFQKWWDENGSVATDLSDGNDFYLLEIVAKAFYKKGVSDSANVADMRCTCVRDYEWCDACSIRDSIKDLLK